MKVRSRMPKAMLVSVVLLWPGAVWMSVAHATTEGHVDVHSFCYHLKPCLSMGYAVSKGHDDTHGPSVAGAEWLPPEAMWMSVDYVTAGAHGGIHALYCGWRLCGCP